MAIRLDTLDMKNSQIVCGADALHRVDQAWDWPQSATGPLQVDGTVVIGLLKRVGEAQKGPLFTSQLLDLTSGCLALNLHAEV